MTTLIHRFEREPQRVWYLENGRTYEAVLFYRPADDKCTDDYMLVLHNGFETPLTRRGDKIIGIYESLDDLRVDLNESTGALINKYKKSINDLEDVIHGIDREIKQLEEATE